MANNIKIVKDFINMAVHLDHHLALINYILFVSKYFLSY